MAQEKYDIFISYRRSGGFETAKHLYDRLLHDGYSVSFDIDTLRNGDFDTELLKRVEECTDFILILNKGAFDRTIDPNFDPQKDWLRQELAHALQLNKNVIPIMLNGFTEFPDNLPADVARVQRRNGPKYDQYYFDALYEKLKDVFLETPKPVKATTRTESASRPTMGTLLVDTDLDCRIFNYGKEVGVAKAGVYTTIELPLGDNDLKYVGLESDDDCDGEMVTVLENHQKLVRVKLLDKYNTRKAKEAAERKAREEAARKAEQERKAKEEAERKAKEEAARKAEQERKAKEEEEKRAKAKAERDAYLLSLPDDEFVHVPDTYGGKFKLKSTGEIAFDHIWYMVGDFHEGLAWVEDPADACGYGFIDKTGKVVIPLKYWTAYDFQNGVALVGFGKMYYGDKKYGFIDKTGKEVTPVKYDFADSFSDGLASVGLNGKCGFVDKFGKEVIPLKYDDAWSFRDGLARVRVGGERNESGRVVGGKYGFIDKTGKEVIPLKYDAAWFFRDGLAKVKLKDKWGFVNKTGEEIIPLKYDYIDEFNDGLARVNVGGKSSFFNVKGGKYGFIDTTGKEVIPVKYYSAASFKNGTALVETKNIFGVVNEFYIDKNGNKVE